jgi:CO/xanthine dehydrogenase Mo-binding subunit
MKEDGSVVLQTGACDIGQGSNTVLGQMVAESLGIPFDTVTVYSADTERTPFDTGSVSSRLTFTAGRAVLAAVEEVKEILFATVARKLQVKAERLAIGEGVIYYLYDPEKVMTIADAAFEAHFVDRRLPMGKGEYYPQNIPVDEFGQGEPSDTYYYLATIAEVEVDTETGVVDVLKMYAAVDCGRAINPMMVEGQIQGGAMQAMGWALREDMYPLCTQVNGVHPEFNPDFRPDNFGDYAIATAKDIPEIYATWVEGIEPEGPFGAKAVGEITANSGAAAIVNAIYDATGVRIYDLPATPEKILRGIKEEQAAGSSSGNQPR